MLETLLPDIVDSARFIRQRRQAEGHIPLENLKTLHEEFGAIGEGIEVSVTGQPAGDGRGPRLVFTVKASLEVTCQRCVQPLPMEVQETFEVAPVTSLEQEQALPENVVPCWIDDELGEVSLWEQVEQAVIVALPLSPRHPEGSCQVAIQGLMVEDVEQEKAVNPFADLANKIATKVE